MSEWKEYRLGQLYNVSSGLSKAADQFGFGYVFISFKDVFWNFFLPELPVELVNSNEKEQQSCSVKKGDILLTRTSESLEEVGMSSVALRDYENSTFNGFCKRLRIRDDAPIKVSPLFIGYLLRTRFFRKSVANYATMTTRASLNSESIKSIPLSFPDFAIQEEIGKTLHNLDRKIELLRQQNQTLEELAQTLFRHWFVEFEFPNEDGEPYKSSGGKMVESELGEIPEGWRVGAIKDFGKIVCGKTPSKQKAEYYGNDIPFLKIPDMHNLVYPFKTSDNLSYEGSNSQRNKIIPPKSIIVSCIATVGLVCINPFECHTNQQINSIIPEDIYSRYYLFHSLKAMKSTLENIGSGGSATLNINTGVFSNIEILAPTNHVLIGYHSAVHPLFEKILTNQEEIQTLTKLRNTLLPKLISGKLRIKHLNS